MQIQPQELRIGNLLYNIRQEVCTVDGTDIKWAEKLQGSTNELEMKPIPLTEEWLIKLRFRKSLENWYGDKGVHVHGNSFWLFKVNYNDSWRVSIVEQTISYVTHVHQLQNLYHALTGEELTVKPTN